MHTHQTSLFRCTQVSATCAGADWLNAPPLRLDRELRGRVVVLDFWTYCCINCLHVLPALARLERKYANQPVTVVGVHSAKFTNEKDSAAVRAAVLRCVRVACKFQVHAHMDALARILYTFCT